MAKKFKVKVDKDSMFALLNEREFIDKLKSRLDATQLQAYRDIAAEVVLDWRNAIIEICPYRFGVLRGGYRIFFEASGDIAGITTKVEYAPFVELGTSTQKAQPHFFPTFEVARKEYIRRLKAEFKESIKG